MMKIVIPHGCQAPSAYFSRANHVRVVAIALRHQIDKAIELLRHFLDVYGHFLNKGPGRDIQNGVDRIEPQSVDMKFIDPHPRVIQKITANRIAVRPFKIDCVTPGSLVVAGEVRPKVGGVIPFWTEMVVDHVEHDRDSYPMAGIDQALESIAPAVGILNGEGIRAVVSPVSVARKLGDRHYFNSGNSQIFERIQTRNDGIEGALGRERPDVQFINYVMGQRYPAPTMIGPIETGADHMR